MFIYLTLYLSPLVYHFMQFPADLTYFNAHQHCFTLTTASLSIHNHTSPIFLLKINKKWTSMNIPSSITWSSGYVFKFSPDGNGAAKITYMTPLIQTSWGFDQVLLQHRVGIFVSIHGTRLNARKKDIFDKKATKTHCHRNWTEYPRCTVSYASELNVLVQHPAWPMPKRSHYPLKLLENKLTYLLLIP
jgi:hypothetical protein